MMDRRDREQRPTDPNLFCKEVLELVMAVEVGKTDEDLITILGMAQEVLSSRIKLARESLNERKTG